MNGGHPAGAAVTGARLDDRGRAMLDFERTWWMESGSKKAAIQDRFAMSSGQYYRMLHELLESRDAYRYDPLVVKRLRRRRAARRRARFEGTSTRDGRLT